MIVPPEKSVAQANSPTPSFWGSRLPISVVERSLDIEVPGPSIGGNAAAARRIFCAGLGTCDNLWNQSVEVVVDTA